MARVWRQKQAAEEGDWPLVAACVDGFCGGVSVCMCPSVCLQASALALLLLAASCD